ncbi:hypothetical protein [Akkermansia glycaniphila]|uniref:Uncharacterized protein n=1 Tax=Akkermansia glycaniphila TaxID=1679444 RepID=A0A1C7PB10_9BACT|nr:hypothetical protein [Akkermansia glycaniphila]OCA02524.1 hypothetical protein AC781_09980 [Akkermansia glycaniphila]SEH89498.1 Hypothetical protein PYTT_1519 [Akkermansia glycaniphila]
MITLDVQDLRDMQCESGSLDLQSMDASTLSLTFARMDGEFLRRWVYGERLRLTRSGKTIFEGWIRDIEHSISAGARRVSISAADKWDDDGKNIYFARESTTSGYIGKATPSSTVYVADTVRDVLRIGGANIVTSPGTMSEMVPFASSSETRQNLTKKIGRWVPNLISRTEWDKPPGSDEEIKKVIIATPREYPPAIIDVSDIVTETIQLKPRYDLCPSSVTIIRHWTDSLGYNHTTTWTVPEGGNPHAVDAYVFETNDTAQGDNEEVEDKWGKDPGTSTGSGTNSANTPQRMTIKGRHIPDAENLTNGNTTNTKFWGEYYPILQGLDGLLEYSPLRQTWKVYDQDEPDPGASDSEAAKAENRKPWNYGEDPNTNSRLRYALFEGEISDKFKNVRWVNATLECYVRFKDGAVIPAGHDRSRLARFFRDDDADDTEFDKEGDNAAASAKKKALRRILTLDCVLIDRFQSSYLETAECPEVDPAQEDYPTDEDKEEAEKEIPADYAAAAEAYYNATRDLQYDGSITIRQTPEEAINYLGCHLSIKGGLPEWETMRTIVQGVSIDLMTDSVSLTLGSRDQEFETPKARNLTKEAREITEDERTSGNMAGSGGGSLADTNRTEEEKKEARGKKNRPSSPAIGPKLDTKDDPIEYHRRPFEITTKAAGYKTEEGHVYGTYGDPVKVESKELSPEVSDWYLVYKVNKDKSIESAQITDRKTDVHSYDETQSTGAWPAIYCIHLAHIENMSISQKWTGDVYFDGAERNLMPFELYRLADKWLINRGKVVSPLGEPTDPALYQAVNGVIATPGKWYLNYSINDESKLVTFAELSQRWQPIHMYDKAYHNNEWPATYCIHVATVNPNGTVIQHHTGDVYFEAELYPPGGGEDNPSSSDSSSAGGGSIPVFVDADNGADSARVGIGVRDRSTPSKWHYSVELQYANEMPSTDPTTGYSDQFGGVYSCAITGTGAGSIYVYPFRRPHISYGSIVYPMSTQDWSYAGDIESQRALHTYGLTYAAKWTIDDDISPGAAPIGNPRILRGIVEIPKGGGLEIGAEIDPDRPQAYHSMTDAELAAHGWVKVCGGMPDSVDGHTHALFMATRRGKLFMFQRTQNYDLIP